MSHSGFTLSARSKEKLRDCHPHLQDVVNLAINRVPNDFTIVQTSRTLEQQKEYLRRGLTTTLRSRHLMNDCIFEGRVIHCCHAVDIAHWIDGTVRWDWPLYHKLAPVFKECANELNVDLEWGGDWKSFPDGPHFQLSWSSYPIMARS